jgi:hypothetical protein
VKAIEQGKESESGDSGYTGCGRLKVTKTILMIVLQVARDGTVGEKGVAGMGDATVYVLN